MAKRKPKRSGKTRKARGKRPPARASAKRPRSKAAARRKTSKKVQAATPARRKAARPARRKAIRRPLSEVAKPAGKQPRLDRERRTLADVVPTPPSSLNLDRHGSAARTGRAELAEARREHGGMADLTGGDPDGDVENAYFSGEEAPGGDTPTPDQDVVDEIGRAVGLEYQDVEELDAKKVTERDRHRWEFDPASSEDYKDRK
jgi:hypothetical protein